MSEETSSQDSPHFITQRRNVMVSCLVVITILVLNLQYSNIKVLDVTAGSPWNFDIAWAVLVWYFVWRLSQCQQPQMLIDRPKGFYISYLVLTLWNTPLSRDLNKRAIDDHIAELEKDGPRAILIKFTLANLESHLKENFQVESVKYTGVSDTNFSNEWDLSYKYRYELTLKNKMSYPREYPQLLSHKSLLSIYARLRCYVVASWTTHYFTEYLLPYLLGLATIFYCCFHHLAS